MHLTKSTGTPRAARRSRGRCAAAGSRWPGSRISRDGPQRAVLLGEALAVFLTESGEPAVVSDRCAHRGASLSMGEVRARAFSAPTTAGSGTAATGPARGSPRLPTRTRSPRAPGSRPFRHGSIGGWSGRRWRSRWASRRACPWFDPDEWTWGHGTPFELPVGLRGDDRELPRRRPFRLRAPGHPRSRRRRSSSRSGRARRARGDDAPRDGDRRWRGRDVGLVARRPLPRDRAQLHLGPDGHRRKANAACCTRRVRSAQPSRRTTGSRG